MNFYERLKSPKPIIMDGAMGTLLFQKVPDYKGPFELLNIEKPHIIEEIHKQYIHSNAELIETNTLGGSKIKLAESGLGDRCEEINEKGAVIAKKAAKGRNVFVGGSIGSSGRLIEPIGDTSSEEIYNSFVCQIKGLERGGVDVIVIETMNDIQEAKLALLAAKDTSPLPVICSITFDAKGKTISGTDMMTGLATLSEYGADVVGANCSMGPEGLFNIFSDHINDLKELGTPLSVWSNAGFPEIVNGKSVYTLSPESFAKTSVKFAQLGIKIIGGCCGTTPEHIAMLKKAIDSENIRVEQYKKTYSFITSRTETINVKKQKGLLLIGERLNPTARKKFQEELKQDKQNFLREESKKQAEEGAHILDINVGVPGINEVAAMQKSILTLSNIVNIPLMIDSDNKEVIEKALLSYPGVGILNSINGKEKSIQTILPILKRFGAFAIALCLDDTGIHQDAGKRIEVGNRLLNILESNNIDLARIFIDPLMLAESAEPGSAIETLKVIEYFAKKGIKTSLGLSNISYGLPERKYINNVYLKMAVDRGLTAAIVNPGAINLSKNFGIEEQYASDFLTGKDPGAVKYINFFKKNEKAESNTVIIENKNDIIFNIYNTVIEGNIDEITHLINTALENKPAETIMNDGLLKALEKVGDLYSSGEYFLPQMISSANTMKKGFNIIKPILSKASSQKLGKIVICTVKGDVHDIGKNIVSMMMENHGFEVYDLGKDVDSDTIINKVKEIKPDILCLSSLLTTTMKEMKVIKDLLVKENINLNLLIGGAVVNEEYAKSIGALYGKDAVDGIEKAKQIIRDVGDKKGEIRG